MKQLFSGKTNRVLKRITTYVVILTLIAQTFASNVMFAVRAADKTAISMTGTTTDLDILTNLQFVLGSDEVKTGQGGYSISGSTGTYQIKIGDETYNGIHYRETGDIAVDLDGLNLDSTMTIRKVDDGNHKTIISVINESTISNLNLENGTTAVIDLSAPVTFGSINLSDGASLTVNTNGKSFKANEISGGKLTVQGAGVSVGNVSVNEFISNDATITGSPSASLTATSSISISNTTFDTFDYIGYHASVSGAKTIELSGSNTVSNVTTFGAGVDSISYVSGLDGLTLNNSSALVDYRINYFNGDVALEMENSWLASYRVKYSSAGNEIVSYHLYSGAFVTTDPGLPSFNADGKGFGGWTKTDGADLSYTSLDNSFDGDINLYAKLIEGSVTLKFDLDYDPSEFTNDNYANVDKVTTDVYQLGTSVDLSVPVRFGYDFAGWKITTGSTNRVYRDSYSVAATDATDEVIVLKAQWEKKTYPFRFYLSLENDLTVDRIKVLVGDKEYASVEAFVADYSHVSWNERDSMIQFDTNIEYGESFADYLSRMGLPGIPQLVDSKTGEGKMDFNGWHTATGAILTSDMRYEMGSLLSKADNQTLLDYDNMISLTPVFVTAGWGTASFKLTTDLPSGWEVLVNGVKVTDKVTTVESGATITWRYSTAVKTNFSYWSFTSTSNDFVLPQETAYSSKNTHITFTTTMPNGNVTASFTDAAADKVYIDLSKSSITYAESLKAPSGRTVNGFWYDIDMTLQPVTEHSYVDSDKVSILVNKMSPLFKDAEKGFFYEYNLGFPSYVTSCEKATTNQVTIINTTEIYFRDVNMVARPEYSQNFVGRKAYDTVMEFASYSSTDLVKNNKNKLNGIDWSECGNIVISNKINKTYITTLRYLGDNNTVASILNSNCYVSTDYAVDANKLVLYGESKSTSSLELGNITYLGYVILYDLTVNEYDNTKHPGNPDNSEYLIYTATTKESNDRTYINGCDVNAPSKRLYNSFGYIYIGRDDAGAYNRATASNVWIGSTKEYYLQIGKASYVRVYGDVYGMRGPIALYDSSSLVVDGSIYARYSSSYSSPYSGDETISNTGYVIVKGNVLSGTCLNKNSSGVLIVNSISSGRDNTISNGYTITNQITNIVYAYPVLDANTGYFSYPLVTNSTVTTANASTNANGDNYPFPNVSFYYAKSSVYSWSGAGTYTYLMGDYDTSLSTYDSNSILWSKETGFTDNAVAKVLKEIDILDSNGDLKVEYRGLAATDAVKAKIRTVAGQVYEEQVAEYGEDIVNHETVTFGNTKFTGEAGTVCKKEFKITGGYIYSAGNMTFLNDATISGGTINCAGTLSSKRDLTISGGTITAREIGNSCQVLTDVNEKVSRYQILRVSGGTLNTNKLGAITKDFAGIKSKSTIIIDGSFTLNKFDKSAGTVDVCDNIKVNYVYSDNYSVSSSNPVTTEFKGVVNTGKISGSLKNLSDVTEYNLVAPIGTPEALWKYDNGNGTSTTKITKTGFINTDGSSENLYDNKEYAVFYATKEYYKLVFKEGYDENYYSSSFNGTPFLFNSGSEYYAEVPTGSKVELQLTNPAMYDKTVVWYMDDSNVLHNAMPECTPDGKIVFDMPPANTEIYVTNNLSLYLDLYNISMTKDGFAVELPSTDRREDSKFSYNGNLTITQKAAGTTYNEMYWESGSGNLVNDSLTRTVTLKGVTQKIAAGNGTTITDNTKVQINFIGENTMAPVKLPATSKVIFKGDSRSTETLNMSVLQAFEDYRFVGNGGASMGDVVFSDLKLNSSTNVRIARGNNSKMAENTNTVSFVNVDFSKTWSSGNNMVMYGGNVIVDNCNINTPTSTGYTSYLFYVQNDVVIKNGSNVYYTYGGTQSGYPIWYYCAAGNFIIEDSEVTSIEQTKSGKDTYIYSDVKNGKIVLNNGTLTTGDQTYLQSLELNGNSVLNVGQNNDGYLMCRNIIVNDESTINSGYVIVSGFSTAQYSDQNVFDAANSNLSNFTSNNNTYPGLVVNGGTVNASEFVGGDYNGRITVNGGEINSKQIGTYGARFAYKKNISTGSDDVVYFYIETPVKADVVLHEGGKITVQDGGYLGGINSNVTADGGEIVLEGNAVIGITDSQLTEVEYKSATTGEAIKSPSNVKLSNVTVTSESDGSINTPYSTLEISGANTAIDVQNITGKNGTVTIKDAKSAFDNPYKGQEKGRPQYVGVIVRDRLSASYINITDDASVYAYTAFAVGDENGNGALNVNINDGGLLSAPGAFGEEGINSDDLDYDSTPNSDTQTVFGIRQVTVTYVLNPDGIVLDSDVSGIVNDNVSGYVVTSKAENIQINDAECKGYYFRGWYTDPECTVSAGNSFNTSLANDITLYAKWEKVTVKYTIVIDKDSTSYSLEGEFDEGGWISNGDGSYTSELPVFIEYGTNVIGNDGIVYGNFNTTTLGITSLEYVRNAYGDNVYTGPNKITNATSVTSEIAEFYKTISNNGTDEDASIVLRVSGVQKRFASIAFYLNKKEGKPADASFANSTSLSLVKTAAVDKPIGDVVDFQGIGTEKSPGLLVPSATGYTFVGWNTNPLATPSTETGWVSADTYLPTTTNVYAVWSANTYLVRFSAGDGSWVTETNTAPNLKDAEVKYLDYYWVYDTSITDENSFWLKSKETHEGLKELPYAWKNGFKFDSATDWMYTYTDATGTSVTKNVSSTYELSDATIKALNTNISNPDEPAITFVANYTPVKVTYVLNGGEWTDTDASDVVEPEFNAPLAGYLRDTNINTGNGETTCLAPVVAENEYQYMIISTTGNYFLSNYDENVELSGYVTRDYRHTLTNKGYSFYGWYETKELADLAGALPSGTVTDESILAAQNKQIVTTPRFEDVTLYAAWHANSYYLDLYSYDYDSMESGSLYKYNYFNMPETSSEHNLVDDDDRLIKVTTGEEIDAGKDSQGKDKWPSRSGEWYAYNQDVEISKIQEKDKRFLLGFTFIPLDPGSSNQEDAEGFEEYTNYAASVLKMQNEGSLFQNREQAEEGIFEGTDFILPDDEAYQEAISGTKFNMNVSVPDYPDGSIIKLYAVYRERSLVFVEQYVAPSGEIELNYLDAYAWQYWSDFADIYGEGNPDILDKGYALIGWYVNGTSTSAAKYPMIKDYSDGSMTPEQAKKAASDTYAANCEKYRENAVKLGTNDIFVYTIYVAQIENEIEFNSIEKASEESFDSDSYVLPASMQNGLMTLDIENPYSEDGSITNAINIVSKEEMLEHQFDTEWTSAGKTYSANDTVAIELVLTRGDVTKTIPLTSNNINTELQISAGWETTLNFYHSKVISESNDYELLLTMKFDNSAGGSKNTLSSQFVKDYIKVSLTPSMYEVKYQVELPEELDNLVNVNLNDFSEDGILIKEMVPYGSSLLITVPTFEGYESELVSSDGWLYTTDSTKHTDFDMVVSAENNGVVVLKSNYIADTYKLSADTDTLNNWTITYTDGFGSDVVKTLSTTDVTEVKYHSEVRFVPKTGTEVPEYISLNIGENENITVSKLPSYSEKNLDNSYSFKMPATNVDADYITVETLYLDEGAIEITESGYTQNGVTHTWVGDYVILQCEDNNSDNHSTENTLKISGDLNSRNIALGNLNISSANSIELSSDANVSITNKYLDTDSVITAKNILVPDGSSFSSSEGTYILNPKADRAAIGASTADPINGQISLNNTNVKMTIPAGSVASGIGSGTQDFTKTSGAISLDKCVIEVAETTGTTPYTGAWIGGNGVSSVNISDTTVKRLDNSPIHMAGPNTISAKTVTINNSKIGTSDSDSVFNPIFAENALTITNSEIHMMIQDNLVNNVTTNAPVGTSASGRMDVTNSEITVSKVGNGSFENLYSGMLILDVESDVTISDTQILDVSNGDINITSEGFTQGTNNVTHSGSYVLIGEKEVTSLSSVVVDGLSNNASITVNKPTSKSVNATAVGNESVQIKDLTINTNTTLIVNSDITVDGNAEISSNKTLTIKTDIENSSNTIEFTNENTFVNSTGKLDVSDVNIKANNIGCDNIDINLSGSTVNVTNLIAGDMVIDSSNVTATGNVGSYGKDVNSVEIKGGSTVTAITVGALGAHNESFTFVTISDDSTITGTLVQDWYRITYDKSSLDIDVDSLDTTFRTSKTADGTVVSMPLVPDNPTGSDKDLFVNWYVWSEDGTNRIAIDNSSNELAPGLDSKDVLKTTTPDGIYSNDVVKNSDGTTTITLYAWATASGSIVIKEGRLFDSSSFSDSVTATIDKTSAFSIYVESNGNNISGRDYELVFGEAQPAGTDLTLTVLNSDGTKDFYYYCFESASNSVKFSEFKEMGSHKALNLAVTSDDYEKFVVAVDYSETKMSVVSNMNINLNILPTSTSRVKIGDAVSVTTTEVTLGKVTANNEKVSVVISPSGKKELTDDSMNVYLVAKLDREILMGSDIKVGDLSGTWITLDTAVFEIGAYGSDIRFEDYVTVLDNAPSGEYNITWYMVYGNSTKNILGNIVSESDANGTITVAQVEEPYLKVSDSVDTVTISGGDITYTYTTNASEVKFRLEKQNAFGIFTTVVDESVATDGTCKITIPTEKGVYRAVFSINDSTNNDNVYFSYIVE